MNKTPVKWYCANDRCANVLGNVANNELVISLDGSVATVNTNGTALAVTCAKCGRLKIWYPNLESSVLGAVGAIRRDFYNAKKS